MKSWNNLNHLAAHHERLQVTHRMPKAWLDYLKQQQKLNDAWLCLSTELLPESVANLCQVVRFCDGQLIISTPNQTLINHLRYLSANLIDTLGKHAIFADIHSIYFVCLDTPTSDS